VKKFVTRLLRLFRGLRCVPGGQGPSPVSPGPTPVRVRSVASDLHPIVRRPYWLGPASRPRVVAVGRITRSARPVSAPVTATSRALRRLAPATAPAHRINRLPRALRARPAFVSARPVRLRLLRRADTECRASMSRHGRTPLLRFSSPATLAGRARAVRGGRPPDDPASAFHLRSGPRSC
jgi:hypothetical protein